MERSPSEGGAGPGTRRQDVLPKSTALCAVRSSIKNLGKGGSLTGSKPNKTTKGEDCQETLRKREFSRIAHTKGSVGGMGGKARTRAPGKAERKERKLEEVISKRGVEVHVFSLWGEDPSDLKKREK